MEKGCAENAQLSRRVRSASKKALHERMAIRLFLRLIAWRNERQNALTEGFMPSLCPCLMLIPPGKPSRTPATRLRLCFWTQDI